MKTLIAAYLFCSALAMGMVASDRMDSLVQEIPGADKVTDPQWIVIFDIDPEPGAGPGATVLNLRVIVRADREGQAVLKATRFLGGLVDARAMDRMKFVEAQEKK